ncbi:MAG: putative adhesin [Acidimicrobiales bacterium]
MDAFVLGHGGLDAATANTFVPTGMRVSFYSKLNENMLFSNGFAALATGGAGSVQTYNAGQPVPNYEMEKLEDERVASYMQIDPGGVPLFFVGGQHLASPKIKLCAGTATTCKAGSHGCQGLLGLLQQAGYTDWGYLACRGIDDTSKDSRGLGAGGADTMAADDVDAFETYFKGVLARDPAEAARVWDGLPPKSQATLVSSTYFFSTYNATRGARHVLETEGSFTFKKYVATLLDYQQKAIKEDPYLGQFLTGPTYSWDAIDWNWVQGANEQILKGTDPGGTLSYWQASGGLLIGNEQPESYRMAFEAQRGEQGATGNKPNGEIEVVSRGSLTSRGKIRVTGSYDENSFETELRKFSKKEIHFS